MNAHQNNGCSISLMMSTTHFVHQVYLKTHTHIFYCEFFDYQLIRSGNVCTDWLTISATPHECGEKSSPVASSSAWTCISLHCTSHSTVGLVRAQSCRTIRNTQQVALYLLHVCVCVCVCNRKNEFQAQLFIRQAYSYTGLICINIDTSAHSLS